MANIISDFIKFNTKFWKEIDNSPNKTNQRLLIEPIGSGPFISHIGIMSKIISKAKLLELYCLKIESTEEKNLEIAISYIPNVKVIQKEKLNKVEYLFKYLFFYYYSLYKIIITKNILGFKIDGVCFGDLLYDTYLYKEKVSTISTIDDRFKYILGNLILNYYELKKSIINNKIDCIIVIDRLGIISGTLNRLGLKLNKKIYNCDPARPLFQTNNLKDFKKSCKKPDKQTLTNLLALGNKKINADFDLFIKERFSAQQEDSFFAYEKQLKFYTKKEFIHDYKLSQSKKIVFIMLHTFNDYPHVHHNYLIFKDYYEWFIRTLEFARNNSNVNWVFKEHPARKYFNSEDVNFFSPYRNGDIENVKFIAYDEPFNNKSIYEIADVIITCSGTAGVEFPSIASIPAILCGDTYYSGYGFTIDCKSKKEYFSTLKRLHLIEKLTEEKQYLAKILFLYLLKYSVVRYPEWEIDLTYQDLQLKDEELYNYYWPKLMDKYNLNKCLIKEKFDKLVNEIKDEGFHSQKLTNR